MRVFMFGVMAVSGLSFKRKPKNAKKIIQTLY
jgi:hypothetical protein